MADKNNPTPITVDDVIQRMRTTSISTCHKRLTKLRESDMNAFLMVAKLFKPLPTQRPRV